MDAAQGGRENLNENFESFVRRRVSGIGAKEWRKVERCLHPKGKFWKVGSAAFCGGSLNEKSEFCNKRERIESTAFYRKKVREKTVVKTTKGFVNYEQTVNKCNEWDREKRNILLR